MKARAVAAATLALAVTAPQAGAQTGTYLLRLKSGASATIAVDARPPQVAVDVQALWDARAQRQGNFAGAGRLHDGEVLLQGTAESADCRVRLRFDTDRLRATFDDCMSDNLPDDFNGSYRRIATATPGDYRVRAARANFFARPDLGARQAAYVVRGDTVHIENIFEHGWAYGRYPATTGRQTEGYLQLSTLVKAD